MDNRRISIKSQGKEDFDLSIKLAMNGNKTIGYRVHENTLVLYWAKSDKMEKLPYEMNLEEITSFAWGWLCNSQPSGKQPDHDGHNGRGFRIVNGFHGEWQAFASIEPIWAMYGK